MRRGLAFLLPALLKSLILPPLLLHLLLLLFAPSLFPPHLVLYLLAVPVAFVVRARISAYVTQRRIRQVGARGIPRVRGRWPLNVDVMVDWGRSGVQEEAGWMLRGMGRRYGGTYNTRVLGEDQIISTDPTVLKHVLLDDSENFVKGRKFQDRAADFLGDGIFNSDGERWRFHRALTRPFFHLNYINAASMTPHIADFLKGLPGASPVDMQDGLSHLSLSLAVRWLCGEDLASPSFGASPEWEQARDRIGWAMTEAQRVVSQRIKIGTIWPLLEIGREPLQEPMRIIRTFFRPIIGAAMRRKQSADGSSSPRGVKECGAQYLIDGLVRATQDPNLVQDQLINLLFAARDTTTSILTFLTYVLALHPDVLERLRHEILHVAGEDGEITKEVIRECRLSRACINETLRLFPPVPLNIRRSLRPALLPTSKLDEPPLYMPSNTSIVLAFLLMQRDPEVWGPDALDFRMDRWLDGSAEDKERTNLMSWSYGPRKCLGQPLALTIAHLYLICLMRHLEATKTSLELATNAQAQSSRLPEAWKDPVEGDGRARAGRDRVWVIGDAVLAIKGGLWIRFAPR